MNKHEELNDLESRQLAIQDRIAASDRAALEYVKGLAGFKRAYPEESAAHTEAVAEDESVQEAIMETRSEWELRIGDPVKAGDIIVHDGVRYRVVQDHTLQADWAPGQVPALYVREGAEGEEENEWPDFVQPTGAHDAYAAGAKITFDGRHYTSLIDNNVWSPADYPQGWRQEE